MNSFYEHNEFVYASDTEIDRQSVSEIGSYKTQSAWILSDRDVWYKNPYYVGPAVRHPEEGDYDDEENTNLSDNVQNCNVSYLDCPF